MEKFEFDSIYKEIRSVSGVAKKLNCNQKTIRRYMKLNSIPLVYKKIYKHDTNFFKHNNESSFYWAGFIAADGCVQNKGRDYTFVFKLALSSKDKAHIKKFKKDIKSTAPIKDYIVKNSRLNNKHHDTNASEILIYSKELCNDLKRFNIVPRKSLVYSLPDWIIDNDYLRHFIRGYIDGDGGFSEYLQKNRNISQFHITIRGTKELLTKINQTLSKNCETSSERKISKYNGIYLLSFCGNIICSKIINYLYKDATIYLDRKYELAKRFLIT